MSWSRFNDQALQMVERFSKQMRQSTRQIVVVQGNTYPAMLYEGLEGLAYPEILSQNCRSCASAILYFQGAASCLSSCRLGAMHDCCWNNSWHTWSTRHELFQLYTARTRWNWACACQPEQLLEGGQAWPFGNIGGWCVY